MNRPRILVSACLLGVNCRYNGERKQMEGIEWLMERVELIPVCPEVLGGLPTPRPPAERVGERVMNREGADVTEAYQLGAEATLRLTELFGARFALLKERSPSCGMGNSHDGSFQGRIVDGSGVTAELLTAHGISVYGESRIDDLLNELENYT